MSMQNSQTNYIIVFYYFISVHVSNNMLKPRPKKKCIFQLNKDKDKVKSINEILQTKYIH